MLLNERLIELRKSKGVSKKYVAENLNIDQSTYGKYELGKRQPSLEILQKIAMYFNVTTDYLLGTTDNPNPKELIIPEEFKDAKFAFHKGDVEDLTQDEVDKIAEYIRFIKAQRK